jgi:hypothetical protein
MAMTLACRAGNPGSIPGWGVLSIAFISVPHNQGDYKISFLFFVDTCFNVFLLLNRNSKVGFRYSFLEYSCKVPISILKRMNILKLMCKIVAKTNGLNFFLFFLSQSRIIPNNSLIEKYGF